MLTLALLKKIFHDQNLMITFNYIEIIKKTKNTFFETSLF